MCRFLCDPANGVAPCQVLPLLVFGVIAMVASAHAQDPGDFVGNQSTFTAARAWHRLVHLDNWPPSDDVDAFELAMPCSERSDGFGSGLHGYVVRGQNEGGSSETGAGAASAVDPSVPLTQLRLQNVFVPSTYDASGYSNEVRLQPVLPLHLNLEFFPYHIVRPTLPIFAPTANPDGPQGVQGGVGDLVLLDVYAHPIKPLKANVGVWLRRYSPHRN